MTFSHQLDRAGCERHIISFSLFKPAHSLLEASFMGFYVCHVSAESAIQKECWSRKSQILILFRLENLPAKHVQYLCLATGRQYWPIPLVNTGTIGTFEDGAHHCTSAYDGPKVTLRFSPAAADGVFLPCIRALDLNFC